MRSDRFIEKSFVYLLVFSVLLHIAVFALVVYLPAGQPQLTTAPVFIDIKDMPVLKAQPQIRREASRKAEKRVRVPRETAPRGSDAVDWGRRPSGPRRAGPASPGDGPAASGPASPVSGLLKSRSQVASEQRLAQARSRTAPSSSRLAGLEETYRRKYAKEVAEGSTRFLNTDDDLFGSFLTRFKSAVYLYWRYPDEAVRLGLEGTTPVKITFNRKGEITKVQVLQSSGYKILDDEVVRTLRQLGPMGAFPKGYAKDEFNLIGLFHYGGSRRSLR
ncbi:MAG TPA: TonB family protein [Deltaproteobacteria bacterium]|nr:TonB family protein [Deltaproteobacteria bacterium]HQB39515.1 TonB family protein [Deltaproteobacteria bacterium]